MMDFAMTTELHEVLQEARQISINFGHYYIHTHHLLASILGAPCLASKYLQDVDQQKWEEISRKELELEPDEEGDIDDSLPLTLEAENILAHAEIFAMSRGYEAINTVDVLIVLLAFHNPAREFLNKRGILMQEVLSQHYGAEARLPELPLEWEETILPRTWSFLSEANRQQIREKLLTVVSILESYDRYEEMYALCKVMLAVEPDNKECLYFSALSRYLQRDFDTASPILESLLNEPAYHENCRYMLGFIAAENGDESYMINEAKRRLAMDPDNAFDLNLLGYYLSEQSQYEEAQVHLKKALQLDPENDDALANLGFSLYKLGQVEDGIAAIEQSLMLNKSHYDAYHQLGIIYKETGDKMKARHYLEKALYYHNEPLYAMYRLKIAELLQELY